MSGAALDILAQIQQRIASLSWAERRELEEAAAMVDRARETQHGLVAALEIYNDTTRRLRINGSLDGGLT